MISQDNLRKRQTLPNISSMSQSSSIRWPTKPQPVTQAIDSQVHCQQQHDPRLDLKSPPRTNALPRSKEKKTKSGDLTVIPVGE